MGFLGFGSQKGQKAKKSKKSKPREVWQGKSFPLDENISPSVLIGGVEHSTDPSLVDLHTLSSMEIDSSHTSLIHTPETNTLELLNPQISLSDHHASVLDNQFSYVLVEPSSPDLPLFHNLPVSTNSVIENTPTLYSQDACPAESVGIYNGESPSGKELPGVTTFLGAKAPIVPLTNVDTGGNNLENATSIVRSSIVDVIDQVSKIDPTDIFRANINDLKNADISVLSGEISVNYLMPSGQFLGSQVFSKGNYTLQLPVGVTGDVIVKIDNKGDTPGTYSLNGFESKAAEPFNIDLEFEGGLTSSQQEIIRAAAKSVEAIITKGLPTAIVDGKLIDDVNFKISATNLDGAGGTAAQTKIDFMRFGTMLPAQSITQFDAADIADLERSGELFSVVEHELLHGLGFGNLWEAKGLVDYAGTPLAQYNGKDAVKAFNELGGLTDNIALENEGNGSAGLHWNENVFQDEVMTADYNNGKGGNAPISAVTIASLADLGYEVNLNRATPDFGLFGGQKFNQEDLSPEQIEAFRQLAETSFGNPDEEFIYATMPEVDPDTVAPEIWAHAERFWKNGEYYDWEEIVIGDWWAGHTISDYADKYMTHPSKDNRSAVVKANDRAYWAFISNKNGFSDPHWIVKGNTAKVPIWHPNYEWEQEQERLRREAELRQRQEEEARIRREQEEAFAREQERVRQEAEARQREAEAKKQQLEEQERRLREEMERRRQEEERLKEEARLRELERQAEITRQQGKGGLDWFIAKPLPEFGPVDPFETRLTGETVGNLVPDDYYRFTLSRNGRITAELKQLLADADLVLYDVRNRPISYSMRDGITDEQLIADLIPGTYMLRVNSPKGVTTDYELIVKFKHLLSQSEKGPPAGWRVGGGNSGNGNSGSSGGAGGSRGVTFADPRIKRIYDTALNNFVIPERAKANTRTQQLGREKQSYEQELQQLLNQMNGEQRAKVHRALDGIRDERRAWVDSVANPIKNGIDSTADWIINQIESNIPGQAYNIPWLGDQLRSAKDSFKGAVNGARSWLKGKVDWVQTGVKDAIWQFTEVLKNAYRTGAEINGAIETAAQQLKQTIDNLVGNINNWVGEFKGKVLDSVQWLRNVGVNIPEVKIFGNTITSGFKWNFYDSVVEPLANNLANGIKSSVTSVGDFAKGTVDWIKPRAQSAVAAVVDAIFGDKTGTLYNKIHGVEQQIEATKTGLERAIASAGQRILSIARQIEAFLTDPEERKRVLDALFRRDYQTAEEAYNFAKEELIKVREQIVEEAKQAFEKAKKAFADLVRSTLDSLLPGNTEKSINLNGGIGIEADAIIAGGTLKGSTEYQLSREFDENGKPFYFTSIKPSVGLEIGKGLGSPIEGVLSTSIQTGNIKASGQLINVKAEAGVSVQPNLGVEVKYKFDRDSDEDMARLGVFTFKELPTPFDNVDLILQSVILQNIYSVEPSLSGTFLAEAISPWVKGEISYTPSLKGGIKKNEFGGFNQTATVEAGLDVQGGFSSGAALSLAFGLNTEGKVSFSLESFQGTLQEISMVAEIPSFAASQLEFLAGKSLQSKVNEINSTIASKGQAISTVKIEAKIDNISQLIDSGSKIVQDIVQLTQVENLGEFTGDLVKSLATIFSFFTNFRNSTEVATKAIAEQIITIEGEGKVFLGGQFNASLGSTESFKL
ncbi:hypothetical protein [Calothrix sp. PCC 6303]|uniref:hypothetical protein n=1 Tax=Calothrix sp. PCC 6303 TaxID=1170562 RepID=UPI0002A04478|nr:hypothetical protein [Calothrix sp. PCC 6303]AFZ04636.1 hypothetical protein Cal6303_5773 [Calothrix sp. PCC 6303]